MDEIVLKAVNITKKYKDKAALDNVTFTVRRGHIYGFIGENGAGKTTAIRVITGLTGQTSGSIELFGATSEKELLLARRRLGCLVERPIISLNETAWTNLREQQLLFGGKDTACIDALLKRVGLADVGKRKVKDFSLGMKQRLGIAMALINNPEMLILDEPVNGLDPVGMVEVRKLLNSLCEDDGITILISSHILTELYNLATDYIIISGGKIIEEISKTVLDRRCQTEVLVEAEDIAAASKVLSDTCGMESELTEGTLHIRGVNETNRIARALHEAGLLVTHLSLNEKSLEDYYMGLLGGKA